MELYLQFGHGMMGHCRELISSWGGGTVVLSPRDMTEEQMIRLSEELKESDGEVLLDPQFYLPHSDHERLCTHEYWPENYETAGFWDGAGIAKMMNCLASLNSNVRAREFILPGMLASEVDDLWLRSQQAVIDAAAKIKRPALSTIALSEAVTSDSDQIEALIEASENWDVKGAYLVCQHTDGKYLVGDAIWLTNMLDLIAGLRLQGKTVVVGYSNQQTLAAACVNATAICSGTWMNVRSFPPDKFTGDEGDPRRRVTWYYCPQALSEYKLPAMDIAWNNDVLDEMEAPPDLNGGYADALFSGSQPSGVDYMEQNSFRHYLHALHEQVERFDDSGFGVAMEAHREMLDDAESLLETLHSAGVRGQDRDFADFVDVNRAALDSIESTTGPRLRRKWNS